MVCAGILKSGFEVRSQEFLYIYAIGSPLQIILLHSRDEDAGCSLLGEFGADRRYFKFLFKLFVFLFSGVFISVYHNSVIRFLKPSESIVFGRSA